MLPLLASTVDAHMERLTASFTARATADVEHLTLRVVALKTNAGRIRAHLAQSRHRKRTAKKQDEPCANVVRRFLLARDELLARAGGVDKWVAFVPESFTVCDTEGEAREIMARSRIGFVEQLGKEYLASASWNAAAP